MFRLGAGVRVDLQWEPIDFRAAMDSLVTSVEQAMRLDPFSGAAVAFHNRGCNRIKLLMYDRSVFWLMMKRFQADRFIWPRQPRTVIVLTSEQLHSTRRRTGSCGNSFRNRLVFVERSRKPGSCLCTEYEGPGNPCLVTQANALDGYLKSV